MKTIITLLICLPFFALCQNDTIKFVKIDSIYPIHYSNIFISSYGQNDVEFEVRLKTDSTGKLSENPSDLMIYGDTSCAMIFIMNQQQKTNELLWAAEDILTYLQLSGHITDWGKFQKAAKKYMNLKKESRLY